MGDAHWRRVEQLEDEEEEASENEFHSRMLHQAAMQRSAQAASELRKQEIIANMTSVKIQMVKRKVLIRGTKKET
jgi:hypothetical protein